jgi:hypothetical protein
MWRFRRKDTRTVERLVRALAALDDEARVVRPRPPRLLRSSLGGAS